MAAELDSILSFWMNHMVDETHGGFIGKLDHQNKKYPEAPKGAVMNSRILWAFSAAAKMSLPDTRAIFVKLIQLG